MSDVEVFAWGPDSKLQHNGACKIFRKNSETSYSYCSGQIEGEVMHSEGANLTGEKKWTTKIVRIKYTFFLAPCPSAHGHFQPQGCM
jgi:hypothetical protein